MERWPECEEGAYHHDCCRFPKSCSCTITIYEPQKHGASTPLLIKLRVDYVTRNGHGFRAGFSNRHGVIGEHVILPIPPEWADVLKPDAEYVFELRGEA